MPACRQAGECGLNFKIKLLIVKYVQEKIHAAAQFYLFQFRIYSARKSANPLLVHSNSPIEFNRVNAKVIREAVGQIIHLSNIRVAKIIAGLKPGAGPGSTLAAYELMSYDLNDLGAKLGLIANTFTDDSSRNAANDGSQTLSDYQTSLILNKPFYNAFKKYADASLPSLKPNQQKYVRGTDQDI